MKNRDLESAIRDGMSIGNFGDNLSLSSWQPSSKPLTYQEKKDIIRRVKLGWVSDDFIKSYRKFVHQEQIKNNLQKQSKEKLSFNKVVRDINDIYFDTKTKDLGDNVYIKKWRKLNNTQINKKFSKLNLEERENLFIDYDRYMTAVDWRLKSSVANKNIIDEEDFKNKNILYYFLILKNTLDNFNLITNKILLKNSVKDAIKELCTIAQSDIFIRKQVISSVTTAITKFKSSDNNSFNNQLFVSERIEKSLKDISGVEFSIKDPLEGLENRYNLFENPDYTFFCSGDNTSGGFFEDSSHPEIYKECEDSKDLNCQSHFAEDDSEPEKTPEEIAKEKAEEKKILDKIQNNEFSKSLDKRYGEKFSIKIMSTMGKLESLESKLIKSKLKLSEYEDGNNTDLKTWNKLKEKVSTIMYEVNTQKGEVESLRHVDLYENCSGKSIGKYVLSNDNLKEYYNKLKTKPCDKEGEVV